MTDLELTENAAKALNLVVRVDRQGFLRIQTTSDLYRLWNPLNDNNDVMMIILALKVELFFGGGFVTVRGTTKEFEPEFYRVGCDEGALVRRVIVRYAAEMFTKYN